MDALLVWGRKLTRSGFVISGRGLGLEDILLNRVLKELLIKVPVFH